MKAKIRSALWELTITVLVVAGGIIYSVANAVMQLQDMIKMFS